MFMKYLCGKVSRETAQSSSTESESLPRSVVLQDKCLKSRQRKLTLVLSSRIGQF